MRQCKTCSRDESEVKFSANRRECNHCRGNDYYARNRDVIIAKARAYYAKDPEKQKAYHREYDRLYPDKKRELAFKRNYGITLHEYNALVDHQGKKCRVCGTTPRARLQVDHCHKTGRIRGLLCTGCNTGIGMFKDDATRLRAAAAYLES